MKNIKAIANQSLFDIAVQQYGSVEAVFDLALANGMSVTDLPTAGATIMLPEVEFDREVATYFSDREYKIATAHPIEENEDYELPGEFPYSF